MTLIDKFLKDESKTFGSNILRIKGNVFEVSGPINCLLYIKTRKSGNQNWGITKNVIERLGKQKKAWFILLLSNPPFPNYFLTADNVEDYVKNRWALNSDGDYKTSPTFPVENKFTNSKQLKLG